MIAGFAQIADLQWNIGQNWISRLKSSKYENFTGLFACKILNDVSNM